MSDPMLFRPLALPGLTLDNRICVAPMCQYSAVDGIAQDWHFQHYGSLAASGPGLIVLEATGVEPEGRISPSCLGLYDDATELALARLVSAMKGFGAGAVAVQLGHAGRKGGATPPWQGGKPARHRWPTVSASDLPFDAGWDAPHAATAEDLNRIRRAFVQSASRALRAGFDAIELHSAHGYLLHQFLSPLSNTRNDDFGGTLENRMRFPLQVVEAVRAVWPHHKPLGIRVSATDWLDGGWTVEECEIYAGELRRAGIDYICVSSGGVVPNAKVPVGPGYQIPLAARIRRAASLPVRAVGLIASPEQAEAALNEGAADMVAIGRGFLDNPRWVWHAAQALGGEITYPPQYRLAGPALWPGAAMIRE